MRESLQLLGVLTGLAACSGTLGTVGEDAGPADGAVGDPCSVIQCPPNQACFDGVCVLDDPCAAISCVEEGTVCRQGSCVNEALDEDLDGSPVSDDCDDADPGVGAGSVRVCQTACGEGLSTCASGQWQACSAPESCDCSPGEVRAEPCGSCGQATRPCGEDGTWGALSACESEGECVPGELGVQACAGGGACQRQERSCDDACAWGAWSQCIGEEECTPGDTESETCGNCGTRTRTCAPSCLWGASPGRGGTEECAASSTEQRACGQCGSQSRTCGAQCRWGGWGACADGACVPGASETQGCGACGTQDRTCAADCNWGPWGACAGQGACTPGTTRSQVCGNCGTQTSTCQADCTYGAWGGCFGEGACAPGATEQSSCGNCGTRSRQCSAACSWNAWGSCGGEGPCAPGAVDMRGCGACGTESRTCSAGCTYGAWGACSDPCAIGCSDGAREAFTDAGRYPTIAGCSGGWDQPGVYAAAAPSCGRGGGDDGGNPSGAGCNVEDLCAIGFHVCATAGEVAARSVDGCAGAADAVDAFFVTRVSGPGCAECATGALAGCTGISCQSDCAPNGETTNDLFGCGTRGVAPAASCTPLDHFSGDQCANLGAPWSCPGDVFEATSVVKSDATGGGALCCRD